MAIYYAIVKETENGKYIQRDIDTGQLEIYESSLDAKVECPARCTVTSVEVNEED